MNERIRELAEQAKLDNSCYVAGHGFLVNDNGMAKFAELIVKECVGILEPKSRYMGEGPEVLKDKIRQIKKHFGVEE